MTGFVALLHGDGAPVDAQTLARMTRALAYRGPDGIRTWHAGSVGLGTAERKTSTVATPPWTVDDRAWIVGDVRVDAREELIDRLGCAGTVDLATTPDAELVLRAYAAWGVDGLSRLLGDYAFALWDAGQRMLVCARSPFGMRALYYAQAEATLLVSNSMHALRAHPQVTDALDDRAMGDFLITGVHNAIDKTQTPYAQVRAVEGGCVLTATDAAPRVTRFWSFPARPAPLRYARGQEYVEHFRHVLGEAVSDRVRTNRIVLRMSGGMDSTTVGATLRAQQERDRPDLEVQVVTGTFEELPLPREGPLARRAAERFGFPIDFVCGDGHGLLDPVAMTCPAEYYLPGFTQDLARTCAAHGRVVMTGSAGDNLLTYEPVFEFGITRQSPRWVLAWLRQTLRRRRPPPLGTGLLRPFRTPRARPPLPAWLVPDLAARFALQDRLDAWYEAQIAADRGARDRVEASLMAVDWNAEDVMRPDGFIPCEERDPFLDVRLLAFVRALPPVPWRLEKHILRKAMVGRVPSAILARRKTPAGALHHLLVARTPSADLNGWRAHADLARFVVRDRVPPLSASLPYSQTYVDLRPRILDTWLKRRW